MISIIYSTNRLEPKLDWFVESLCAQTSPSDRDNMELIFIDYDYDNHKDQLSALMEGKGFKGFIHSKPKPNIYQGEHRKTKGQYFSPANARNTGIILSSGDYLVFADDVSVLMPGWVKAVQEAAGQKMIVCGAYKKHYEMVVENGILISSVHNPIGVDSRWGKGGDYPVKIEGSQLFGCSFGISAEDILSVNGFDEICDSIGGEDYHLGIRLSNMRKKMFYDRRMLTIESEELHNQPYLMQREDRVLSPDAYMSRLHEFGIRRRYIDGNWDSSHMVLDILYGKALTRTFASYYDLRTDRQNKTFTPVPSENHHWFDKKPLEEML